MKPRTIGCLFAGLALLLILMVVVRPGREHRGSALGILESTSLSPRHDALHWALVADRDPELWELAIRTCLEKDPSRHPNCRAVLQVAAIGRELGPRTRGSSAGIDPELDMRARQQDARRRLDSLMQIEVVPR